MPRRDRSSRKPRRHASSSVSIDEAYLDAVEKVAGETAASEGTADASSAAPADDSQRKTFGSAGAAWIDLEIPSDGNRAILKAVSFAGDKELGYDGLKAALVKEYGIEYGLNDKLVQQLAARAAKAPFGVIRGDFPIAEGKPPNPGEDGRIEYPCLDKLPQDVSLSHVELPAAIAGSDEAPPDNLLTLLVAPGTEVAMLFPPGNGEPGSDIFGQATMLEGVRAELKPGANVSESEGVITSEILGYLRILKDEISVLSPLRISEDRMEARFVFLPQAQKPMPLQIDWLMQMLESANVKAGILDAELERIGRNLPETPSTVLVAKGTAPQPGQDTSVDFVVDLEKRSGKFRKDGSVDLRERNSAIGVANGQSLGQVVPATAGTPGIDVTGEELSTIDGTTKEFVAGENVRSESKGEVSEFVAECDGNLSFDGSTITVSQIFSVKGDVDYEVGNIHAPEEVQISGSVCSGFTVEAGGSVTIGGAIEAGAYVNAKGDVLVAQSIVGDTTKVISFGDVVTKFIQNSSVVAKRDVLVGSYIFNAHVQAGRRIVVEQGGGARGGSIVGGDVRAALEIEARHLGSTSTDQTLVGISLDPQTSAKMRRFRETIDACNGHILRILRTLGLQKVDSGQIKDLIRRTPKSRRKPVIDMVEKLNELLMSRREPLRMFQELEKQNAQGFEKRRVKVTEKVFANVEIVIGEQNNLVADDLGASVFYSTAEGIRYRPLLEEDSAELE